MRDYQTKSNVGGVADSISATRFGGGEFNSIAVELENAVTSSNQTLAPADGTGESSTQLAQALAIYGAGGAAYMVDTGAVNAYVLDPVSPKEAPSAYFDGFTVSFVPGTVNTGASTVNINSIGSKSITNSGGLALTGGEISNIVSIRYNSSDDRFEITSRVPAMVQIYTSSSNYSKPAGLKYIIAVLIGAGGGGGGGEILSGGRGGDGGASGSTAIKFYSTKDLSSSEAYTIGSGGTGGITGTSDGTTGGTSTFVGLSAAGGQGGFNGNSTFGSARSSAIATGGDINLRGYCTNFGLGTDFFGTTATFGGKGAGSALFGGGGSMTPVGTGGVAGPDGYAYGGGGNGGSAGTVNATDGGDGNDGALIIFEFF